MLDKRIRLYIDPVLAWIAKKLDRPPITADRLTLAGLALVPLIILATALEFYALAFILIGTNRLLDGLDGSLARQQGVTVRGGFLDSVADFLFYGSVPFAFALARPEDNALASAFVLFSFIGTGTSFLAYAVIAAKLGRQDTDEKRGAKGFHYLGSLTEGTETILFLLLCCLLPDHYALLAWGFGSACWLAVIYRFWRGYKDF